MAAPASFRGAGIRIRSQGASHEEADHLYRRGRDPRAARERLRRQPVLRWEEYPTEGKIGVDVTTVSGDPFQIDAMAYKNLPLGSCTEVHSSSAALEFTNALDEQQARDRRHSGSGDNVFLKGMLSGAAGSSRAGCRWGPAD